ncbi:hypothetical protein D3C78_1639200 [compost metagenome]
MVGRGGNVEDAPAQALVLLEQAHPRAMARGQPVGRVQAGHAAADDGDVAVRGGLGGGLGQARFHGAPCRGGKDLTGLEQAAFHAKQSFPWGGPASGASRIVNTFSGAV